MCSIGRICAYRWQRKSPEEMWFILWTQKYSQSFSFKLIVLSTSIFFLFFEVKFDFFYKLGKFCKSSRSDADLLRSTRMPVEYKFFLCAILHLMLDDFFRRILPNVFQLYNFTLSVKYWLLLCCRRQIFENNWNLLVLMIGSNAWNFS